MEEFNFVKYSLEWYEYIVFGLVLAISLGIGIFYGFFGTKNKTNEEFLMGSRSMGVLPVTLSLLCSFVSAIALLGYPLEVYLYGTQFLLIIFAFIPMTIVLVYIYVPVYYDLQLTSAYEYFEWRFSRSVRILLSLLAMGHLMIYMPTVIWGPALALHQVAGIDPKFSSGAIFLVCIVYSSIGGLKAVVWSDALQAFVMIGSLFAVLGLGVYEVGGFGTIWETSQAAGRLSFFNVDTDLRTRHTIFSSIIGGYFSWITIFAGTQSQIQRYNSVPSFKQVVKCLIFNMCGMFTVLLLCGFIGLIIFTEYGTCDPIESKKVSAPDQIFPLFVMDVLRKYTGLPGLLVAGLTSASLSSVSSALNALAAIIVEDFVKWGRPGLNEVELGIASKLISVVTGLIAFGLVYVVAIVNETVHIQPFAGILVGTLYGPVCGAFTLGMIFPWVNNIGVLCGIISSMLLTGGHGVGSIIAGKQGLLFNQRLPLTVQGCNSAQNFSGLLPNTFHTSTFGFESSWKDETSTFGRDLFNVSYMWQATIGVLVTIVVGLIVSVLVIVLFHSNSPRKVNHRLLSKPFLNFWKLLFGQEWMNKWVDYDTPSFGKNTKSKELKNGALSEFELKVISRRSAHIRSSKKYLVGFGSVPQQLLLSSCSKKSDR